jgi:hypothetical protein
MGLEPFVIGVHYMVHEKTWGYKPSETYLWFLALKIFYNVFMFVSTIAPRNA